jgi:outer membrane lipoprotein-sorting protein
VALLALMLAFVAGCKSSKKDSGGEKTPAAAESPSADKTPTDGGDGGDGGGGDGDLQDLEQLASEAASGVTAKVTYKYTSEAGGQTTESEWTVAQRPPDSRYEIVSSEGGAETRTIVIVTPDNSYICISGGGSETCLKSKTDETQAQTAPFAPLFDVPRTIAEDISGVGAVDKSERDIGGVHATCFSADTAALGGGASEVCFSDEGILLYLKSEAGGSSFTIEATAASTDVTDADFEPPYEVIELPSG